VVLRGLYRGELTLAGLRINEAIRDGDVMCRLLYSTGLDDGIGEWDDHRGQWLRSVIVLLVLGSQLHNLSFLRDVQLARWDELRGFGETPGLQRFTYFKVTFSTATERIER
jgi:hypothetical protein